eukprot:jgi/Hompol1/1645/HPOL_001500-RA
MHLICSALLAVLNAATARAANALSQEPLGQQQVLTKQTAGPLPVVFWHGMGDSCCNPKSIGRLTEELRLALEQPLLPVHSVRIGSTQGADQRSSYFDLLDRQIDEACSQIAGIPDLAAGFNAVGISQGGLFLRAAIQRCSSLPPVHTLITLGSPHAGVADAPNCENPSDPSCSFVRTVIRNGVYLPWVQQRIVQAQYVKLWDQMDKFLANSAFLADINSEREPKPSYAKNLSTLRPNNHFHPQKSDTTNQPNTNTTYSPISQLIMSSQPCGKCQKTVYPTEKMEAAGHWWHKACFKCNDEQCGITLNLKNFKAHEGAIFCEKHVPMPTHTQVADSVAVVHALHAPKKAAEGLHKAQLGTGETPSYGLDTISVQHALTAPKKVMENLGNVKKGDPALAGNSLTGSQEGLNA